MVFVVALSKAAFKEGGDYTWVDVVEKDNHYFHLNRPGFAGDSIS